MTTQLPALTPTTTLAERIITVRDLVDLWLSGRPPTTRRGYASDLRNFQQWVGLPSPTDAAGLLLSKSAGDLNGLALAYRNTQVDRGKSSATTNRRLSVLKSLLKVGRMLGLTSNTIDVPGVRALPVRDVRGPGRDGIARILRHHRELPDCPKVRRDIALLSLMYALGLRRGEVRFINLPDLDLAAATVMVVRKGGRRLCKTLPPEICETLARWVEVHPGATESVGVPLFCGMSRVRPGSRLRGESVGQIITGMGRAVGVHVRSHGIRHASVTAVLDLTGGDIRAAMRFAGHSSPSTTLAYDDSRKDYAGKLAKLLAADLATRG